MILLTSVIICNGLREVELKSQTAGSELLLQEMRDLVRNVVS